MRLSHRLNRAVAWGYLIANPARGIIRATECPGSRSLPHAGGAGQVAERTPRSSSPPRTARPGQPTVARIQRYAFPFSWRSRPALGVANCTGSGGADVDMKARTLTVRRTKNGDARTVPLTDTAPRGTPALPRPPQPEPSVFPERDPKVLSRSSAPLVRDLGLPRISASMTSRERARRELDTRAPRHDRPQPGLTGDREPVDLGAGGRPPLTALTLIAELPERGWRKSAPPRRLRTAPPLPSRPWHAPGPAPDPRAATARSAACWSWPP